MTPVVSGSDQLRRLFAAITENVFQVDLGIADPLLTDYIADLLYRFVRMEAIIKIRDAQGRRLEEVAEMLIEAEQRLSKPKREIHRHIGDFTLFWVGLFPEALARLKSAHRKDHLIDYCEQGKRSYLIASTFEEEPYEEEAPVLRRLSEDFELCTFGLNRVRLEWDNLPEVAGWNAEHN